ncbi:MAG: GDSL-type esterase/lipase family protein [Clostridiales bacterium]|nr:GDSL-type esterase/lipase family protein [Clostridiales bacterium]
MRRATALVLLVAAAVLILVLMIRGCSGSEPEVPAPAETQMPQSTEIPAIYGKISENVPKTTHNPAGIQVKGTVTATANPNAPSKDINQGYFKNSVFLGNSMVASMEAFGLLEDADYFGKVGLNVSTAESTAADNGTVPIIDELNGTKQYSKVFLMFGENECAWPSGETFKSDYTRIVKKIMRYQPEAQIYLMSITPMSKTASDASPDGANKDNILKFNGYIEEVAQKTGAAYVNVYDMLADADGYLPEKAASDGIHFEKDYYVKMLSGMAAGN